MFKRIQHALFGDRIARKQGYELVMQLHQRCGRSSFSISEMESIWGNISRDRNIGQMQALQDIRDLEFRDVMNAIQDAM